MAEKSKKKKAPKRKVTRAGAMRKADAAFSMYIRTRDSQEYGCEQFRCISCGKVFPIDKADAGHYVNRSHAALRFSEENVHAQCRRCNRFDEGNIIGYRKGLLDKIGEHRLAYIEGNEHEPCRLGLKELLRIAEYYTEKTAEFEYQISKNGDKTNEDEK